LSTPHVAIAILNYNGKKHLEIYLPSVMASTYGNKSIWVIDNGSNDGSLEYLASYYPQVQIVKNSGNIGFAAGYNAGLQNIPADYYVLLNSDVEVTPNFIEPMVALMENDVSIAFAQPKLRWLRNKEMFEYAGGAGGMIDTLGYPFCKGRILEHLEKDLGQYDGESAVFWATGACMFARASVYKLLGGMYEYYYMHNEEIDLCWRAQNMGHKIVSTSASTVFHLGGGSLEWENPKKTYYTFRNNMVMNIRNMPVARLLWLIPLRTALDAVAAVRFIVGKKTKMGWAVFKAMADYWIWLVAAPAKKIYTTGVQKKWPGKRSFANLKGVFKGSIVWNYFVRKKKTYQLLKDWKD